MSAVALAVSTSVAPELPDPAVVEVTGAAAVREPTEVTVQAGAYAQPPEFGAMNVTVKIADEAVGVVPVVSVIVPLVLVEADTSARVGPVPAPAPAAIEAFDTALCTTNLFVDGLQEKEGPGIRGHVNQARAWMRRLRWR